MGGEHSNIDSIEVCITVAYLTYIQKSYSRSIVKLCLNKSINLDYVPTIF